MRSARTQQSGPSCLKRFKMVGELPSFNDWHGTVADHEKRALYLYGGCRPRQEDPCSDFYRLDVDKMRWENLTERVRHVVNPSDAFSTHVLRPLPPMYKPSIALMSISERTYMLIYGGRHPNTHAFLSEFIAVDLEHLIWWHIPIEPGVPRMSACMSAVANRVFVFGGCTDVGVDEYDIGMNTFSVAEYVQEAGVWRWAVWEREYPGEMPRMGSDADAVVVFGGQKILLTVGRHGDSHAPHLSSDGFVLLHTRHLTFQVQPATIGDFPGECQWYSLQLYSPQLPAPSSTVSRASPSKRRKIQTGPQASQPAAIESTLLCSWVHHPQQPDFLMTEIYQYKLPPDEECVCLGLSERIWNLNLDLQAFVVVGGRAFLMGFDGDADREDGIWNVAVEIEIDKVTAT